MGSLHFSRRRSSSAGRQCFHEEHVRDFERQLSHVHTSGGRVAGPPGGAVGGAEAEQLHSRAVGDAGGDGLGHCGDRGLAAAPHPSAPPPRLSSDSMTGRQQTRSLVRQKYEAYGFMGWASSPSLLSFFSLLFSIFPATRGFSDFEVQKKTW